MMVEFNITKIVMVLFRIRQDIIAVKSRYNKGYFNENNCGVVSVRVKQ